jgi:hypothetical protein
MLEIREVDKEFPRDPTCAWCLDEQGFLTAERQGDRDSHGVCNLHANLEYAKFKFARVKPYVERFRDGREKL